MKGIITTIFITLVFAALFFLYAFGFIAGVNEGGLPRSIIIIVSAIFLGLIYALVKNMMLRIKEIREGKEDDISKY